MILYNVFYKGDYQNDYEYEATTDNFDKWLKDHNEEREADGNEPEDEDDFDVQRISVAIFNEENK